VVLRVGAVADVLLHGTGVIVACTGYIILPRTRKRAGFDEALLNPPALEQQLHVAVV
jgi:hypothetical protein